MTATMLLFSSVIVFVLIEITHVYICFNTCTVLILFPSKQWHNIILLLTSRVIDRSLGLLILVGCFSPCCTFQNWGFIPW